MFDLSSLTYNSENPTFIAILFTVLCSFLLSGLITFTYEKTSRQVARPENFIQALVLISIVAAMVMQAIGDSLARGLGMLGALAIIRFRTTLRNPRNMVFMFASIAVGMACGVTGFVIAFVGTITFCLVAWILYFTPFSRNQNLTGTLVLEVPKDSEDFENVQKLLNEHCDRFSLKRYKTFTGQKRKKVLQYEYKLNLKNELDGWNLANQLRNLEEVLSVRLDFVEMPEEL